jgi:hypothetical protein
MLTLLDVPLHGVLHAEQSVRSPCAGYGSAMSCRSNAASSASRTRRTAR